MISYFLFDPLKRLFAGLALVWVVARDAFKNTSLIEEAEDAVAWLSADAKPMLGAFGVERNALFIVLGEQRVIRPDLLNEVPIARAARIGNDDTIIRALL